MTEALVQFSDRLPTPAGSVCTACGFDSLLLQDHCHEHGWVRAIVCMRCNQYLGSIDRRIRPGVDSALLATLVAIRNRCPDCEPLSTTALARPAGHRPRRSGPSPDPRAVWSRLRRLAIRKGFDLTKVRDSSACVLASRKRRTRKTFASIAALEEFLNCR